MADITIWGAPELTYQPRGLLDEVERWAGDLWDTRPEFFGANRLSDTVHHPYDLYELKDELYLKMEMPGYKKEDIGITLEGDTLTLKAERKPEELPEEAKRYHGRRWYGSFIRQWTIPFTVDAGKVTSAYEDGILEITLPRAEKARTKQIEIKVK